MDVQIKGIESLIKKLDYLGGNSSKVLDKGLKKGAVAIRDSARTHVPYKTGTLKNSIAEHKIKDLEYSVGTNVKYAAYIEYGTGAAGDPSVPHTQKKFWRYKNRNGQWVTCKGMAARPYMRTAFSEKKDYVVKLVRNELAEAIRRKMNG